MTEDQTITIKNVVSELLDIYQTKNFDLDGIKQLIVDLELDFPEECEPYEEEIYKITNDI